jgi:hypothetical protein
MSLQYMAIKIASSRVTITAMLSINVMKINP